MDRPRFEQPSQDSEPQPSGEAGLEVVVSSEELHDQTSPEIVQEEESEDIMFPGSFDQYSQRSTKRLEREERAMQNYQDSREGVKLVEEALLNRTVADNAKTGNMATKLLNSGITKPITKKVTLRPCYGGKIVGEGQRPMI